MKKSLIMMLGFLLIANGVFAEILVKKGDKTTKQAKKKLTYGAVTISAPAKTQIIIEEKENGSFEVKGTDLKKVQVGHKQVTSTGVVSFTVSSDNIAVKCGVLRVYNAKGQLIDVQNADPCLDDTDDQESLPEFVNAAVLTETVSKQATEDAVLSPSAPR